MMVVMELYALAVVAGVVSFTSPCCLPLLPGLREQVPRPRPVLPGMPHGQQHSEEQHDQPVESRARPGATAGCRCPPPSAAAARGRRGSHDQQRLPTLALGHQIQAGQREELWAPRRRAPGRGSSPPLQRSWDRPAIHQFHDAVDQGRDPVPVVRDEHTGSARHRTREVRTSTSDQESGSRPRAPRPAATTAARSSGRARGRLAQHPLRAEVRPASRGRRQTPLPSREPLRRPGPAHPRSAALHDDLHALGVASFAGIQDITVGPDQVVIPTEQLIRAPAHHAGRAARAWLDRRRW